MSTVEVDPIRKSLMVGPARDPAAEVAASAHGSAFPRLLKGLAAGLVGGAVACWVMDRFEAIRHADDEDDASAGAEFAEAYPSRDGADEDATLKVARTISRRVFHRELPEEHKERAGLAVHYAFGSSVGALYGVLSETAPGLARGAGLPFGAAVWLSANEIAVPALRLGKPPMQVPFSEHAFSLATHFVYGVTTDTVRRLIRRALGEPARAT